MLRITFTFLFGVTIAPLVLSIRQHTNQALMSISAPVNNEGFMLSSGEETKPYEGPGRVSETKQWDAEVHPHPTRVEESERENDRDRRVAFQQGRDHYRLRRGQETRREAEEKDRTMVVEIKLHSESAGDSKVTAEEVAEAVATAFGKGERSERDRERDDRDERDSRDRSRSDDDDRERDEESRSSFRRNKRGNQDREFSS